MEYYLPTRKKGILLFVTTWMCLEGMRVNEISQTEKDKDPLHGIAYLWNLKKVKLVETK